MNMLLWHLVRPIIWIRRGRLPPASMPNPVWFFAYGSNMNERLIRERRHMVWHEAQAGRLDRYRLVFSFAGGMKPGVSAPANIVEAPGESVWGVLYSLPLRKFARLDNSEGKQYAYLWTEIEDVTGNKIRALTYKVPHLATEGRPRRGYLDLIREAAPARPARRLHCHARSCGDTGLTKNTVLSRWRRWSPWLGGLVGIGALGWVLRRIEFDRFFAAVADADARFLVLVPIAIAAEQVVRAWKWRQLLSPLRSVGTAPLFGAIMAGFFAGLLFLPAPVPLCARG